ncbi:hypothetical protein Fot_55266 [Forsythia ovata]|uniref:Uncharacterized protein n=1 Tax=Forsythia ovata TaxID=205694 RepID=A0ABD1P534_9LAMI
MADENSTFLSTPWKYANFLSPSSPIPSSSTSSSILNSFLQAIRFLCIEKAYLILKSLALKILRRITSLFSSSNSGIPYILTSSGGGGDGAVFLSSFFGFSVSGVGGYSFATGGGGGIVFSSSFFGFSASGVGGYSSAIDGDGGVSSSSLFGFSASRVGGYSSATSGGGAGGVTS